MEPDRYPVSVRLVGVMVKEKKKMYLVSVLWSDQNDIVVYRSFRDFQILHKQMKKAFPTENKLKKSDRVIPKFHYKKEKRNPHMKSAARSLVRLKFLQKYCDDLLSCDPRVCQSTDLVQFFHPTQQDLQPEFSKNSVMVMPSDDVDNNTSSSGNVTKPFVTETYRCVAVYETKDTKNKAFKVAPDEKVDVLIKDKGGWWLVENEAKQMAWFPAPYLDKLDDDSGDEDELDGSIQRGARYTAIKNYAATKSDEISVSIGAVVEVLQESDNGWWFIRYKEKAGYIPSSYLRPYNYPHIRTTPHHLESPNSPLLQIPSLGQQFSRSQENLLTMPSSRPSSPRLLKPESKQKSRSLNLLNVQSPPPSVMVPDFNRNHSNGSRHDHQLPTITIQVDDEDELEEDVLSRSLGNYSLGSFDSESDFSLSDSISVSSGGSSLTLNATEDLPRPSRTPQPPKSTHLSPTSGGRLMPSLSDPNLYKSPASPKIPPRPKPQQIMTRCTTITRKNAAKGTESVAITEM